MSKKKRVNVVYSTNPDYEFETEDNDLDTLPNQQQQLKVLIDRKQRKGKSVTLISNFVGNEDDLKGLGKILKNRCGVGGSAKNGEIIIQGEFKDKIYDLLIEMGYSQTKKVGGY